MVETDDLEVNSPDATSTSLDLENLKNGDAADTSLLAETEAHLDSSRSTSGALVVVEGHLCCSPKCTLFEALY